MDREQFQKHFTELTHFKENRFHPLVWINGEPEIGENVYIAGMSEIYAKGAKVVIGDHCDIASFVAINCADSHKKNLGISDTIDRRDITIEHHVFIGSHSVVKGGAHIGHHSVVAAGTIVEGVTIPPYSLVIGNPMMVKEGYYRKHFEEPSEIQHNKPTLGKDESDASERVIRSGWVAQGQEVELFEKEFCRYLGLPEGHAVAVSSGTAALYLALWSLNAQGQKVAIPAYTCSSLRHAVAMNRSEEVILDSDLATPNMSMEQLFLSNANTAIIPHMYGIPTFYENRDELNIVEDCAQALGAIIHGKPAGLWGKLGVFSFYATKLITSGGQGGMIVSRDRQRIEQIKDYRQFDQRYDAKARFNFQMTELQAAIGRVQLSRLPEFIEKREQIFRIYRDAGLDLLDTADPAIRPVRYRALIKCQNPEFVVNHLRMQGIKSIIPLEGRELLSIVGVPKAQRWTGSLVSLPIYPSLQMKEVDRIIQALRKVNL